jgi:N-acetylglucosaminyldiphosphoundecaprenol N-acetyl-beta-D-mannosaminyltransferase
MEWAFRLLQEPRRLAKRYLWYNPLFVIAVALQAVRQTTVKK